MRLALLQMQGQVDVNGDEGYYSLSVELNRKGVVLNSHFQMKDN